MVQLVVKGTKFPDEFCVERTLADDTSPQNSLVQTICHIQNMRHQVKLMLLSATELLAVKEKQLETETNKYLLNNNNDAISLICSNNKCKNAMRDKSNVIASDDDISNRKKIIQYKELINNTYEKLKEKSQIVTDDEYDMVANNLRYITSLLFPNLCTHEQGELAAIDNLYKLHEDPTIDEDLRLQIYNCRAIIDKEWKRNEWECEENAGLWFCNKIMSGPLSNYCGKNERSKLTIKVKACDGVAPAAEPRISYDDQRALYVKMQNHKETMSKLEESELRELVRQKSRGALLLPTANSNISTQINTNLLHSSGNKDMLKSKIEEHIIVDDQYNK